MGLLTIAYPHVGGTSKSFTQGFDDLDPRSDREVAEAHISLIGLHNFGMATRWQEGTEVAWTATRLGTEETVGLSLVDPSGHLVREYRLRPLEEHMMDWSPGLREWTFVWLVGHGIRQASDSRGTVVWSTDPSCVGCGGPMSPAESREAAASSNTRGWRCDGCCVPLDGPVGRNDLPGG